MADSDWELVSEADDECVEMPGELRDEIAEAYFRAQADRRPVDLPYPRRSLLHGCCL